MATWRLTIQVTAFQVVSLPGVSPMVVEGDGPPPTLEILTPVPIRLRRTNRHARESEIGFRRRRQCRDRR